MNGNDFLDKMELIDAAYVETADCAPHKNKQIVRRFGALAACFAVSVAGAVIITHRNDSAPASLLMPEEVVQSDGSAAQREDVAQPIPGDTVVNADDVNYVNPIYTPEPDEPDIKIEVTPDSGYVVGGPFNHDQTVPVTPCISSYGEGSYSADLSVANGGVHIASSLSNAMEHYGDNVTYRVMLVPFADGIGISAASQEVKSEAERLFEHGYTTAQETITNPDGSKEHYFYLISATCYQIEQFPAAENLGYLLVFYDEYLGAPSTSDTVVFNGFANAE